MKAPTATYSIADGKSKLTAIVHEVERGRVVALTRRGNPVAVMVSVTRYEELASRRQGFWEAVQEFRKSHDIKKLRLHEAFEGLRDRELA